MAKLRRKIVPSKKSSTSKPKAKAAPVKAKPAPGPNVKAARKVPVKKARVAATPKKPAKLRKPAGSARRTQAKPASKPAPKATRSRAPQTPPPPAPPPRRNTYVDAIAMYERGVRFLQARKYKEAADALKAVIAQFPEEKELHERALLYLRVCERGIASTPQKPESAEERVYAATLAINNGSLDQAVAILAAVIQKDPENDQATYMMGVAQALKGHAESALQHLARSMALNRENRDLAFKEPDLEALRRTDEMKALLAFPPAQLPRKDRPVPARARKA